MYSIFCQKALDQFNKIKVYFELRQSQSVNRGFIYV